MALKEMVDVVRKELDSHVFHKDHIKQLIDAAMCVVNGLTVQLMTPEQRLYQTICEIQPHAFSRHDVARYFAQYLSELYNEDGSKKGPPPLKVKS
jgi:hypothetical protein